MKLAPRLRHCPLQLALVALLASSLVFSSCAKKQPARQPAVVGFYVGRHNAQMPHAAFDGHTPDEVYFGTAPSLPAELAAARIRARAARIAFNRALSCATCLTTPIPPNSGIPP